MLSPVHPFRSDPAQIGAGPHPAFAAKHHTGSIFAQDWWLDAAAPGAWHRVEATWGGHLVGSMSFAVARRAGLRFLEMPPLTRTLSPLLAPTGSSPVHRLHNRVRVLEELLGKLPSHDRLEITLEPGCDSKVPFVMLNYPVAHTYTFVTAQGGPLTGRMHQKTRNVVNKAAREFNVVTCDDPQPFLVLLRAQRGPALRCETQAAQRLYDAARSRRQATVLRAVNHDGKDGGCAILVWDAQRLYFWLSARDPAESSNGALSLLITHAAQLALSRNLIFDADGWGTQRSAMFLSKFGFEPVVRGTVNHGSQRWKLLHWVTSSLCGVRDDRHYRF